MSDIRQCWYCNGTGKIKAQGRPKKITPKVIRRVMVLRYKYKKTITYIAEASKISVGSVHRIIRGVSYE